MCVTEGEQGCSGVSSPQQSWDAQGLSLRCSLLLAPLASAAHRAGGKQWAAASFLQPDLTLTLLLSEMKIDHFPQGFFPDLGMSRRMVHCSTAPYQPVRREDQRHLHAVFKAAIPAEQ